jgi:hypothetical protein
MAIGIVLLLLAGAVYAQSGGGYDLTWNTVDNGGATFSQGGGYSLGGTLGQPDAGLLSGGGYTLAGGFWAGGGRIPVPEEYHLYLPLVMRNK